MAIEPHKLVGIVAVTLREDAEPAIVYLQRPDGGKIAEGLWCIPSGHVEKNETERAAAARELFEETGIKVDPSRLIELGKIASAEILTGTGGRELPIEATIFTVILPDVTDLKDIRRSSEHTMKRLLPFSAFDAIGRGATGQDSDIFLEFTRSDRLVSARFMPQIEQLTRTVALARGTPEPITLPRVSRSALA